MKRDNGKESEHPHDLYSIKNPFKGYLSNKNVMISNVYFFSVSKSL